MDWGLALVIAAVVFLVGHMALDGYRMFRDVRRLRHAKYESLDACERCATVANALKDLRHEVGWTAAAVVVLAGHLTLDMVS